jgi:hypothetical protein
MKKSRKLVLHRETLHTMELRAVAGAVFGPTMTPLCGGGASRWCNEGSYGECPNTLENCSAAGYCQTGGACSTSGSCD